MRIARTFLICGAAGAAAAGLFAQGRNVGNEWPTASGDAQRTNWMRSDPNISIETLGKPGFELQWKAALEGQRGLKPAVQGVTVNGVTLFTPLSIVTGGNDVIAIDNDTGATFWYKSFGQAPSAGACAAPVAATRVAPAHRRARRRRGWRPWWVLEQRRESRRGRPRSCAWGRRRTRGRGAGWA